MKKLLLFLIITLLGIWNIKSYSDELNIPFSCWPQDLKKNFEQSGRKLDLSPAERTEDSWGYIWSEGSTFKIFTYKSATPEDFEVIKNIVFKIELAHKE